MCWIKIDKSNFADKGKTVRFVDGMFICERHAEADLKLPAANIIFLNRHSKARSLTGRTDTNIFKYVFYGGVDFAFFAAIIRFFWTPRPAKPKRKLNTKVIVRFSDDRTLSGKTRFNTFFAIQNAWLDSK